MKIFVANFSSDTDGEDLQRLFQAYGEVADASIAVDWDSGKSRGFGFVLMPNDAEAEKAIEELDGWRWHGCRLKVSEARPKR